MKTLRRLIVAMTIVACVSPIQAKNASGSWYATVDGDDVQLNLVEKPRNQHGFGVPLATLTGLDAQQIAAQHSTDVAFQMRREAGTIDFRGTFARSNGAGTFSFTPSEQFLRDLRAMGFEIKDDGWPFLFTTTGFTLDTVRGLRALGFQPTSGDLEEIAIFKVTPEYVREFQSLGYKGLSIENLVELRIGGVTPERIREYRALGYTNLAADKLSEAGIHGATPEFIRKVADAGYRDVPIDTLIEMRIFGVTPEFIKSLQDAGYRNVPIDKMVEIKMAGADKLFTKKHD